MPLYVVQLGSVTAYTGGTDSSTATIVGDPSTAWRDDSDGTYAQVQVATSTNFYGWAEGTSIAAPDLPYMHPDKTKFYVEIRASGSGPLRGAVRLEVASTLQAYAYDSASWPGAPAWMRYPITEWAAGVTPEDLARYCREGRLQAEVRPPAVAGYHYIYEARFLFDTGAVLHPCVQFPRSDGLASSSARQHYPRDKSWQTGARWHGGYY